MPDGEDMPPDAQPSVAERVARWVSLLVIVASVLLILRTLPIQAGVERFAAWVDGLGAWGPVLYALVYATGTVLLLPGSLMTFVAGAAFGLWRGVFAAWLGATGGIAATFLIARYLARGHMTRIARRYPRFAAVERAVSESGWKIIALLRLSPVVPFNLQNYLYGLTGIRFWTCVVTSALAILPGMFVAAYLGDLTRAGVMHAAQHDHASPAWTVTRWALRIAGLIATIAATIYLTHKARRALKEQTDIDTPRPSSHDAAVRSRLFRLLSRPATLGVTAVALLALAVVAQVSRPAIAEVLGSLTGPPTVTLAEAYEAKPDGPRVDHTTFDRLLERIVTDEGMVDYALLRQDPSDLTAYIEQLAHVPLDELGRDEKLALLINAYNAFTLQLILDHWPLASIREIDSPWTGPTWNLGGRMLTLDEIEHQEIRGKFDEPRIHFAVNCASVGCPPLRAEAYTADRLDAQLEEQARFVHRNGSEWFRFDRATGELGLTKLYDWYADDFEQAAGSVVAYAARYNEKLAAALAADEEVSLRWLDYDWRLNAASEVSR